MMGVILIALCQMLSMLKSFNLQTITNLASLIHLLPEKMEKLYRIEEQYTAGWTLIDPSASKLTREQCDRLLQEYLERGYNPNDLRAVLDVD